MHELPKELTKSLRSWRGSIYGTGVREEVIDLEKQDDYGGKVFEEALDNSTENSLIPHPKYSNQALNQARQAQSSQQEGAQQDNEDYQQQASGSRRQQWQPPSQGQSQQPSQAQDGQQQQPQKQQGASNNAVSVRQPTFPPQTPVSTTAKKSIFTGPRIRDPDPAADRLDDDKTPLPLADFYELMGMKPPIAKNQNPKELHVQHGLYSTIMASLTQLHRQFLAFDVLTYALLLAQLALSAVFIVLGTLTTSSTHLPIAILGAVSTVIAGSLALMKGQGLPNRLRQARDSMRNVQFAAEELYWDVGADRTVFYEDVRKLREDYLRVLEEVRRNHPDTWTKASEGIGKGITAPQQAHSASLPTSSEPKP